MMNPVVHFEMPYRDAARAAAFYAQAFGWETENLGPAMGDYLLVTTARSDAKPGSPAGAINGGLYPFKPDWPVSSGIRALLEFHYYPKNFHENFNELNRDTIFANILTWMRKQAPGL